MATRIAIIFSLSFFFLAISRQKGLVVQAGNEEATVLFGVPNAYDLSSLFVLLCSLRQILMNTQVLLFIIALEESRDYQPATGEEVSLCKILQIGYY